MATVQFVTVKGSSSLTQTPFYVGLVQHDRTLTKKETYAFLEDKLGFKAPVIQAAFLGLKQVIRENADAGNVTFLDEITRFPIQCKGAFASNVGPWVKGVNYLELSSVELDGFKKFLEGIVPTNKTEGAKPIVNSVLDTVTGVYDVLVKGNAFTIAGSDLGPDATKTDEYVALVSAAGVETKCTIASSSLQAVTASFSAELTAGEYTLKVYTRSGLGSEFGVKCASRQVVVAVAN